MTGELWQPLGLSLRIAASATLLTVLLGTPLAYGVARRSFPGRSILEGLILLPLVLPPTVVGYLILMSLGSRGWLLRWLGDSVDYSIAFRFEGAVLAALVVALPMLYMPAKAAFGSIDRDMEDAARIAGANRLQVFWHVSIPLARRGLVSGVLLAFARALGEFGATVMVMGDLPNKQTLPIAIYNDYVSGDLRAAAPAVAALTLVSLVVIVLYNRSIFGRRE